MTFRPPPRRAITPLPDGTAPRGLTFVEAAPGPLQTASIRQSAVFLSGLQSSALFLCIWPR
jgi:hypothetical protein